MDSLISRIIATNQGGLGSSSSFIVMQIPGFWGGWGKERQKGIHSAGISWASRLFPSSSFSSPSSPVPLACRSKSAARFASASNVCSTCEVTSALLANPSPAFHAVSGCLMFSTTDHLCRFLCGGFPWNLPPRGQLVLSHRWTSWKALRYLPTTTRAGHVFCDTGPDFLFSSTPEVPA